MWWNQGKSKFGTLDADIYRIDHRNIEKLSGLIARTMDLSVTITGQSAYVTSDNGEVDVNWEILQLKKI